MSVLSGKKVLLGISGGIAAYKTPNLVRCLIKNGAEVKVVMTDSAKDFVTPLSLSTVSKNPVYSSFKSDDDDALSLSLSPDKIPLRSPSSDHGVSRFFIL